MSDFQNSCMRTWYVNLLSIIKQYKIVIMLNLYFKVYNLYNGIQ